MGEYLDIFEFIVANSSRLIMKILIEPSFRNAVCFQVHQMNDGSTMLFWNFEPHVKHLISSMHAFAKSNNLPLETTIEDVLENPGFSKVMSEECKVSSVILIPEDIAVIKVICNAQIPANVKHWIGLDGHSYTITVFDNANRIYHCDDIVPKEYALFIPLINLVIHYAKLDRLIYGPYYAD